MDFQSKNILFLLSLIIALKFQFRPLARRKLDPDVGMVWLALCCSNV